MSVFGSANALLSETRRILAGSVQREKNASQGFRDSQVLLGDVIFSGLQAIQALQASAQGLCAAPRLAEERHSKSRTRG